MIELRKRGYECVPRDKGYHYTCSKDAEEHNRDDALWRGLAAPQVDDAHE